MKPKGENRMKRVAFLIFAVGIFCFSTAAFAQTNGSIEAEELNYNINTKAASAVGNVIFTKGQDVLRGDRAKGVVDKQITVYGNPVRGDIVSRDATVSASKAVWTADPGAKNSDCIEAYGTVRIRQGKANFLNAPSVKVITGRNVYEAHGGVELLYNNIYAKAVELVRNGEDFRGTKVAKLENRKEKYAISADEIYGKIDGKDEVKSAVAHGNVIFDNTDKNGIKSRLFGNQAVYDRNSGNLVVTGNAHGVREDGKTIKADKLVYNEKTKLIEAIGNTKITFVTDK